jgi:uncharacterized protein (TIGR03437 family)
MFPVTLRNLGQLLLFLSCGLCLFATWQQAVPVRAHERTTTTTFYASHQPVINGRIAYSTHHRHGDYHIHLVNADGSGHFELPANGVRSRRPAWSFDGTKLAFERDNDIYIVNHDGSGLRNLTDDRSANSLPTWSPDGTRLAHMKGTLLYTINADGTGSRRITNLAGRFQDVDWSPNGTKILFILNEVLKICDPDGSNVADVLSSSLAVESAAWSPDGTRIVLTSNGRIHIVNADGTGLTPLTSGFGEKTPVFSPDGTQIAFLRGVALFTMNADGTNQAQLPNTNIGPALANDDGLGPSGGLSWQRLPAGAPLTFVISGRVTNAAGQPLAGRVELSGGRSTRTDLDGFYSFGNLPAGNYTVELHRLFFSSPQPFVVTGLSGDFDVDFTAAQPIRHTISGRITDTGGVPLRGVRVAYSSNLIRFAVPPFVTTDENGFYQLTNIVPRDGTEGPNFSVIPAASYATFTPSSFQGSSLTSDLTVNFTARRSALNINGRVVDADGVGLSNVTVMLSGADNRTVTTAANGTFDLGQVPGGLSYTVTAMKEGLTFAPARHQFTLLDSAKNVRFTSGAGLLTIVSSASLRQGTVAGTTLLTAFGSNLTTFTETATSAQGQPQLGGVRLSVQTGSGNGLPFDLFFASPSQINFRTQLGNITGEVAVVVTSVATNRTIAVGTMELDPISPSLFTANATGSGVAAAVALRVKGDGTQQFEPAIRFDSGQGRFVAVPLDLGAEDDQLFLVLYGLGINSRTSFLNVTSSLPFTRCQIGGVEAPVTFTGGALGFGIDQVNVRLPRELIGRGEVDVVLTVAGKAANTVRVAIK